MLQTKQHCDFDYVWRDPFGKKGEEVFSSCVERLPNKGHRTKYRENTALCGDADCDDIPEEHYCALNVTDNGGSTELLFDGQRTWGVCNDTTNTCVDEDGCKYNNIHKCD